jgi:hypothetical protein
MAHALVEKLDEFVERGDLREGAYIELVNLVKRAKANGRDELIADDLCVMAPLLEAAVGDEFIHHSHDGSRDWLADDRFVFLGRADGRTRVPKGWWCFRLVSAYSRGICQQGSDKMAGREGGMLDAIGAWPLADYRNYKVDGTFDDRELALPSEKCWGFRVAPEMEMSDDEWGEEESECGASPRLRVGPRSPSNWSDAMSDWSDVGFDAFNDQID